MKTKIMLLLIAAAGQLHAQYNYANLDVKTDLTTDQLKTYTYENMRIYPVHAKESFVNYNKNIGKYTPLKEAVEKEKIKITETSDGNARGNSPSVNKLYIQNVSSDTVYIMGGEVVKGGKQDRVISEDLILPPKGKKIDLEVYCVEHGRWTGNSPANSNEFKSTANLSSISARKAAQVTKEQSKVWDEVEVVTSKNKSTTSTGTYTALGSSKDYTDKVGKYISFFKTQLAKEPNIIGFVAATADTVMGCDLFATSVMFNQQVENLLRSYATEAITNGAPVKIANATVKKYMDKLLADESARPKFIEKSGKEFKKDDKVLHMAVY
jgi:hypothetical protein